MTDFNAILQYDRETGIVRWRKNEAIAGTKRPDGYTQIVVERRPYLRHRLIWKMETGEWPVETVDHIDGDRTNDKWSNLREATRSQNNINRPASKRNASGHCGVSFRPESKRWRVRVAHKNYGHFDRLEDAIAVRDHIATGIYGEFARTKAKGLSHSPVVAEIEALVDDEAV